MAINGKLATAKHDDSRRCERDGDELGVVSRCVAKAVGQLSVDGMGAVGTVTYSQGMQQFRHVNGWDRLSASEAKGRAMNKGKTKSSSEKKSSQKQSQALGVR